MLSAVIIDDESNALDVLSIQLKNYCTSIVVVEKCLGGEAGIKAILQHNPDLVFLDIEMPRFNGFDVLDATKHKNFKVIFTTAYDQFAIKAFKYSAIDYLLKPIDIEELKSAVFKLKMEEKNDLATKINLLYSELGLKNSKPNKIALPFGDALEMIPLGNIVRCESESNYTTIYLNDERKTILSKTLKEVEENLLQSTFFRVHNSHIINLDYIAKIYKNDGGYVVMQDGTQINISRSRREEFFELMRKI